MILAVCNQKGGVGKTTVAINIAGALNAAGEDVLLVDLDPQGHATEGLGYEDEYWSDEDNLFTAFAEDTSITPEITLSHAEMDVIPSNHEMTLLENALLQERGREFRLRQMMETVEDGYDHIVFDCPPNLGTITDNAVIAAENILIPVQAEKTSTRALEILFESQIEPIEKELNEHLGGDGIETVGIVANKVSTNDNESEEVAQWLQDTFPVPNWAVMQRVAIQRAWDQGCSIFEYQEPCDMKPVFEDVAREIITGDSNSPDSAIAFKNERGSILDYVRECAGESASTEQAETDGGKHQRGSHTQQTIVDATGGEDSERQSR